MYKNVLIFSHSYKDGFIEATNQYTLLFDPAHYHVTVMYFDGEPDEAIRKKHIANEVLFLNTSPRHKRGLKLSIIRKLLTQHKTKKFDIVICHRYKPTYIMLWVNRFCKIPHLICIMHEMKTFKSLSRKFLLTALDRKNVILAGVSNAVCNDLKNSVIGSMKKRVVTLYNAIDVHSTQNKLLSRFDARQKLNLSDDYFVFGILGRLVTAKNHKTLIEAFAMLKPLCSHAKLVIIGEGELKSTLQAQISQLRLENDIQLTGFLPDAFSLLTAFDVFVLSSIKEAFGRVLIEAMVAKCPIIATKTNGIPEVLGDIGILVEKENPEALAKAMLTFYKMSSEERRKQSELSYQRAVTTFSIEKFRETFHPICCFSPHQFI